MGGDILLPALCGATYWGRSGTGKDYQLSYSNTWQRLSFTLSATQTYDSDNREDKRFNIYLSIPLTWG